MIKLVEDFFVEARFAAFFDESSVPMAIFSKTGKAISVNKSWLNFFQTITTEYDDYNLFEDIQLEKLGIGNYLGRALRGENVEIPPFYYDPALIGKMGRPRWVECSVTPIKDELRMVRELALSLKDVTDQVVNQKALEMSLQVQELQEKKYRLISERLTFAVKAGNIGVWQWVPGSQEVKVDAMTEKILGFELGTFPGTVDAIRGIVHPDERKNLWTKFDQVLQQKEPLVFDHRIYKKDGTIRWIQASFAAFFDEDNTPYLMMGTLNDITDRKKAEADQKFLSQASDYLLVSNDYKETLKSLCHHANNYLSDGVIIDELLPTGKLKRLMVVHQNPATVVKLMKFDELYPERLNAHRPIIKTLLSGNPSSIENLNQYYEDNREILGDECTDYLQRIPRKSALMIRLKGRENVLGIITFFTNKDSKNELGVDQIWLAKELATKISIAFENALIYQNAQEAIRSRDEFLSIASHELKTPLQSLTLQNQMRMRNIQKGLFESYSSEQFSSMVEADLRHLHRIRRLIEDMLDISRLRAGKLTFIKERVNFCEFIDDVVQRFRPQLDASGCILRIEGCKDIETLVEIDTYRIEQVLVNILTNAIRYGAGKPITLFVKKTQNTIKVMVEDHGPGIKEQDLERIFEKFERAISREVSGLGLGLYISRQIIDLHGGSLYATSVVNKGSTFIFELPL